MKNNAPAYVAAANKLLQEHNLVLDICPGVNKVAERTLAFDELVNISHEETLRNMAHKSHYHDSDSRPLIFVT